MKLGYPLPFQKMIDKIKEILKAILEVKKEKDFRDLKKRVDKLEDKDKPKSLIETAIEQERKKNKKWLFED